MLWFDQSWLVSIVDVSVKSVVLALLAGAALAYRSDRDGPIRQRNGQRNQT